MVFKEVIKSLFINQYGLIISMHKPSRNCTWNDNNKGTGLIIAVRVNIFILACGLFLDTKIKLSEYSRFDWAGVSKRQSFCFA